MFIYSLALLVGFKLPLHPMAVELLKRYNISPHQVVPNTWMVLVAVPAINANMGINLGQDELLSIYYFKFFESGNFDLAICNKEKWFAEEAPQRYEKEWADELLRLSY